MSLETPITKMFNIKHPILLAGMNVAAGPELAAAVSNAGGLGVIGGLGYTPDNLRRQIRHIKEGLNSPNLPFGVDLLIPAAGGSKTASGGTARKTNYDYSKGKLSELIDVIIEEKTSLFVCAIGVPPKYVVEKLHAAGIPVMNMVGKPIHVKYALEAGVDLICCQGGEGGGHTGNVPTSILVPACVDACKGKKSPLTGEPIYVVAAGGIADGRGLAAALMWGAQAVWVGTRFVAATEASAPPRHKELILTAGYDDVEKTLIYTGRPLRVRYTPYVKSWNEERAAEIKDLTGRGILPHEHELESHPEKSMEGRPWLMGSVAASIHEVLPAKVIVESMVKEAREVIQRGAKAAKL